MAARRAFGSGLRRLRTTSSKRSCGCADAAVDTANTSASTLPAFIRFPGGAPPDSSRRSSRTARSPGVTPLENLVRVSVRAAGREHVTQVAAGVRRGNLGDLLRRAGGDDVAAFLAPLGAEVDDPV